MRARTHLPLPDAGQDLTRQVAEFDEQHQLVTDFGGATWPLPRGVMPPAFTRIRPTTCGRRSDACGGPHATHALARRCDAGQMKESDAVVEIAGEATRPGQVLAVTDLVGDATGSVIRVVPSPDPQGRRIVDVCLDSVRFFNVDLGGSSFHEAGFDGVSIWAWGRNLTTGIERMTINGVEIQPLVDAELDRRFPERLVLRDVDDVPAMVAGVRAIDRMWAPTVGSRHVGNVVTDRQGAVVRRGHRHPRAADARGDTGCATESQWSRPPFRPCAPPAPAPSRRWPTRPARPGARAG